MVLCEGVTAKTPNGETLRVREVWEENLENEMEIIRGIVDQYPYIAMDTEFPGVVVRPVGYFTSSSAYHYQTMRCNVDILKLIQLGMTFSDEQGNLPKHNDELCVWQFNFKEFALDSDIYSEESIELLKNSGIDFQRNQDKGIDVSHFGELMMCSGIVLNDQVKWITFHSSYDFGYLMKVLTCQPLPKQEQEYFGMWKLFFPRVYDIKYMAKYCDGLHGGLNKMAETLEVERIGPQHQAGSDSLLTLFTFTKIVKTFFSNSHEGVDKHCGMLFGYAENGGGEENGIEVG